MKAFGPLLGFLVLVVILAQLPSSQRYPDVPTLHLRGKTQDITLYHTDVMKLLAVGWEKSTQSTG